MLDFLVNFCPISTDYLTLDRIKKVVELVKYIDWVHLTPDSVSAVTRVVADMTNKVKSGTDPMTTMVLTESLASMNKFIKPIMASLKVLTDFQRESYKLDLRDVTAEMPANEAANAGQIKKKFVQAKPGVPFYPDLAEEVIKEDYSKQGPDLRNEVLKKLEVAGAKPQAAKEEVSLKKTIIDGIQILGNAAGTLSQVAAAMDANRDTLESRKKSFLQILKQIFGKGQDALIYEVKYTDKARNVPVYEKVNYTSFRADLDKKIHTLTPLKPHGTAIAKLEAMQEEQLLGFLEKNLREINGLLKIFAALDEFFKSGVDPKDRDKIKGIRPELETIRNSIQRANNKLHDYTDKKGEEQPKHPEAPAQP
jgi:hypothetical protein